MWNEKILVVFNVKWWKIFPFQSFIISPLDVSHFDLKSQWSYYKFYSKTLHFREKCKKLNLFRKNQYYFFDYILLAYGLIEWGKNTYKTPDMDDGWGKHAERKTREIGHISVIFFVNLNKIVISVLFSYPLLSPRLGIFASEKQLLDRSIIYSYSKPQML